MTQEIVTVDHDVLLARQNALLNVLVRNRGVVQYYINCAFQALNGTQLMLFFKALQWFDKSKLINQDNFWTLIPRFISTLSPEQLDAFVSDVKDIALCVNREYSQYLPQARGTNDNSWEEGERQDHTISLNSETGNDETYTSGDTGYKGRTEVLPLETDHNIIQNKA